MQYRDSQIQWRPVRSLLCAAMALVLFYTPTTAPATVFYWDNYYGDGSFQTRYNWTPYPLPTNVPGTGDTAVFNGDMSVNGLLQIGPYGRLELLDSNSTITEGGLVSVAGTLAIDLDMNGDSFIYMKTGGMLAIMGDADDSIAQFLDFVGGTDAINYWDDSISDWAHISGAMRCRDYALNYLTAGDLSGYTLLTARRTIDGDANGDGVVDVTDLGILATNYGAGGGFGWCGADFNGDGIVNVSDLGIPATHYGQTATQTAAPEPGMLALLATCCLTLMGLSARRRKR